MNEYLPIANSSQHIRFGQIILVEKAAHILYDNDEDFFVSIPYDAGSDQASINGGALWQATVRDLTRNPSRQSAVTSLFDDDYQSSPLEGTVVDGQTVIDVFHVRAAMGQNMHSISTPSADQVGKEYGFCSYIGDQNGGIWPTATMANHSCVPNSARAHLGDLVIMRATKDIKKGEEIFSPYRNDYDYEQRQAALEGEYTLFIWSLRARAYYGSKLSDRSFRNAPSVPRYLLTFSLLV